MSAAVVVDLREQPVPRRALAISISSLALPVAAAIWIPDGAAHTIGTLTWLTALIPAFLLAYYRGFAGVAVALAGGMAVITATQISIVVFDISEPDWPLLLTIVGVYLVVSLGIGVLAEVLRRERHAAEEMALIDRLTGLPNRRHADLVLEQEFAAAARGTPLAVVIYDLDRFKTVNDRFGHASGDDVLRAFARVLQDNTRKANLSARFGGEEFISVLRAADADAAVLFAQRILDQARLMKFPWGNQTVSAGVAVYAAGMGSYELLVGEADRALYQAKEGGRDRVCIAATPDGCTPPSALPSAAPAATTTTTDLPAPAAPSPMEPVATSPSYLLAAPSPIEPVATSPSHPLAASPPKVYVVDDDVLVLGTVKRMLNGRGMIVWGTSSPDEAIRSYAAASVDDRPALIITDIIMPTMTGTRMMEQITRVNPAVRVIYMSGYVHEENSWTDMPGSVVAVLAKPIIPDKMRDIVARELATIATSR